LPSGAIVVFTFDFVVALRLDRSKAREHERYSIQDDAFVFPQQYRTEFVAVP
jgi:hypothetical protein